MPRKPGITPEIHEQIVNLIKAGNYIETAAAVAGVPHSTVRRWIAKGHKGDGPEPYGTFARDVNAAVAIATARDVMNVSQAANGIKGDDGSWVMRPDWRASAWRLERRDPDRWGQTIRYEVLRRIETLLDEVEPHMSREAYAELVRAIASVRGVDTEQAVADDQEHAAH